MMYIYLAIDKQTHAIVIVVANDLSENGLNASH